MSEEMNAIVTTLKLKQVSLIEASVSSSEVVPLKSCTCFLKLREICINRPQHAQLIFGWEVKFLHFAKCAHRLPFPFKQSSMMDKASDSIG